MGRDQTLRLIARESADVPAISAALQDSVGLIGDFLFEPKARQFTCAFNRFRWEAMSGPSRKSSGERVRTALQAGGVLAARAHRLKQGSPDAVVSLLSITFEPGEEPSGSLVFTFSGGGILKLDVECVDMVLADVSEPWRAVGRPEHPDNGEPQA